MEDSEKLLSKLVETLSHHLKEKQRKQIYEAVLSEVFIDDMNISPDVILGFDSILDEVLVEMYPENFHFPSDDEEEEEDTLAGMLIDSGNEENSEDEPLWDDREEFDND